MPFEKGKPRAKGAGRKKGTPNKSTAFRAEMLTEWAGEAIEMHVAIMRNQLPCGVCRGKGKSKYQAGQDDSRERKCASCHGDGLERLDPKTRQWSADSILDRVIPKLKSIEHSGSADKPPIGVRVILVDAPKRVEGNAHAGD